MESTADGSAQAEATTSLPEDFCVEIRSFAEALPELDYYQVLGIERDAPTSAVRDAFFDRSKRFHPDRYFNKNLGPYEGLLHEIYKRVVAANEVLRNEQLRRGYDQTLPPPGQSSAKAPPLVRSGPLKSPAAEKETKAAKPKRKSLRDRDGLKAPNAGIQGLQRQLENSREKSQKQYEIARDHGAKGDWEKAAHAARLALAFDPRDKKNHEALAEYVTRANSQSAQRARADGMVALGRGEEQEAFELLSHAFQLQPTDAELAFKVAELCRRLFGDEPERALEYAQRAAELDPRIVGHRKLLGLIYMQLGRNAEARKELQRAWELDPLDKDVKQALGSL
jgi:curved DNA-binding protein CbpA